MPEYITKIADRFELEMWDSLVEKSDMGTLFHKYHWLKSAEKESGLKLLPIIVYKEKEPKILLPIFEKKILNLKFFFSPPPKCFIPYLGIITLISSNKQNVIEKNYFKLIESLVAFIKNLKPIYINIRNSPTLQDYRPLVWNGYKITPKYTYYIKLRTGSDSIFYSFKSQIRTDIKRAKKYNNLIIKEGNIDDFLKIIFYVKKRFENQKIIFNTSYKYFIEIFDKLRDNIHIKAIYKNDKFLTGLVLLNYKKIVRHWIGGIVPYENLIGLNELLHWETIEESIKKGYNYYDLMGANTKHLCSYKSKFNPKLILYFEVEKRNNLGSIIKYLYIKLDTILKKRNAKDKNKFNKKNKF